MNKLYKIVLLCTLFFVVGLTAFSQQNHFVYIQTENKQPFYVKLNNKLLSSSVSGYIIIPKLQNGTYEFTIGFPKNEWSEQNFTCAVNKKDAGYLLKDFGDKGWGLFNLQSMEVVMAGNADASNKAIIEDSKKETAVIVASVPVLIDSAMVKKSEDKPVVKEEVKRVNEEFKNDTLAPASPLPIAIDSAMVKKSENKPVVKEEVKPVNEEFKNDTLAPAFPLPIAIDSAMAKKNEEKPVVKEEVKPVKEEFKKDTLAPVSPLPTAIDSAMVKKSEDKSLVKEDVKSVKEEVKSNTSAPVSPIAIDSIVIKKLGGNPIIKEQVEQIVDTFKNEGAKSHALITKLLNVNTAEGAEMIYVDIANGKADTISVFIPAQKDTASAQVQTQKKLEGPKTELQNAAVTKIEQPKIEIKKEIPKKIDKNFINITLPNPNAKTDTAAEQIKFDVKIENKTDTIAAPVVEKQKENIKRPVLSNYNCKAFASEDDFLKLRKKMAAETNDDDMIDVARKVFKIKCFTTEQIKNLCVLFLIDEGRYKFFDAAYPFVLDAYNFSTLEVMLTDNYFINRFKVMIRH
jgi:hypothetical protein